MNWNNFGKVGTFPVDGQVYAQPLYVSGVAIGGAKYNVVYVATMHNSVFAFNADAPQSATPLWQVNLGPIVPSGLFNFTDILPEIGILGTPAIDADAAGDVRGRRYAARRRLSAIPCFNCTRCRWWTDMRCSADRCRLRLRCQGTAPAATTGPSLSMPFGNCKGRA